MGDEEKTTVVVKNIPNKYTQEWLLEEVLALGLSVDFLYLPRRMFAKPNNIGFGFMNFSTAADAQEFLRIFDGRRFPKQPNSTKTAQVGFAKLQGKEANVQHYTERAEQGVVSFWVR
jgi:RNA recognition motif-containing protein